MTSLNEILAMSNSEIEALYHKMVDKEVANGRKDTKLAVNCNSSVADIKRAQLAIYACQSEGLTRPLFDI